MTMTVHLFWMEEYSWVENGYFSKTRVIIFRTSWNGTFLQSINDINGKGGHFGGIF